MASAWVAGLLLLFYVLLVPGAILYITRHHREKLYSKHFLMPVKILQSNFLDWALCFSQYCSYMTWIFIPAYCFLGEVYRMFSFLYSGYEEGHEWWEVCVLARKTVIALAIVYFRDTFLQSLSAALSVALE